MSETSLEYRAGFARLLPEIWQPGRMCAGTTMYVLGLCHEKYRHGHHEIPCPDIRAPGKEALAWQALEKLGGMWWMDDTLSQRIYIAIEVIGRTP